MLGDFVDDGGHQRLRVLIFFPRKLALSATCSMSAYLLTQLYRFSSQSVHASASPATAGASGACDAAVAQADARARHGGTPSMRGRRAAAAQEPRQVAVPGT